MLSEECQIMDMQYQEVLKSKRMQEIVHMFLRLVEPKLRPNSSPESLEFFVTDQSCIKPNYLYIFNNGLTRVANS